MSLCHEQFKEEISRKRNLQMVVTVDPVYMCNICPESQANKLVRRADTAMKQEKKVSLVCHTTFLASNPQFYGPKCLLTGRRNEILTKACDYSQKPMRRSFHTQKIEECCPKIWTIFDNLSKIFLLATKTSCE